MKGSIQADERFVQGFKSTGLVWSWCGNGTRERVQEWLENEGGRNLEWYGKGIW